MNYDPNPRVKSSTLVDLRVMTGIEFQDLWEKFASKYGSDKFTSYFDAYAFVLNSLSGRPIKVLEIGVQNGGFQDLLLEILPSGSDVVGVDINFPPICPTTSSLINGNRNIFFKGSILEPSIIESLQAYAPFDLIIDDASHLQTEVVSTVKQVFNLCHENGYYLIEDTFYAYWPGWGRGFFGRQSISRLIERNFYPSSMGATVPRVNKFLTGVTEIHLYPGCIVLGKGEQIHAMRRVQASGQKSPTLEYEFSHRSNLKKILYRITERNRPRLVAKVLKVIITFLKSKERSS